jgi:hypothetical protein
MGLECMPRVLSDSCFRYELFVRETKANNDSRLSLDLLLANYGDGDAYDVRVFGSDCDVAIDPGSLDRRGFPANLWGHRLPVLKSGAAVKLVLAVPSWSYAYRNRFERKKITVIVVWTTSPGRGRHHQLRRRVESIEVIPPYEPGELKLPFDHKYGSCRIPFFVRSVKALEKRAIRSNEGKSMRAGY